MSNPFIKFWNWEIFISHTEGIWSKIWVLKKWEFKINEHIEETLWDNGKIVKIRPLSAHISWEVEEINIELLSSLQENFDFMNNSWTKKLTLDASNKKISPFKVRLVNTDNSTKTFSIEMFNSYIKNSLSFIFKDSSSDPSIKLPLEFVWIPDMNNKIFEISDTQES